MGVTTCQPAKFQESCTEFSPCCNKQSNAIIVRSDYPGVEIAPKSRTEEFDADGYRFDDLKDASLEESYFTREVKELLQLPENASKDGRRPTFFFSSGSTYTGEWQRNTRHGFGHQRWYDGAQFVGLWKNNLADGCGKFHHPDGSLFVGQWQGNVAKGIGILYDKEETPTYRGRWEDDLQHGCGVELMEGGVYRGEFVWGKKQGKGEYEWPDKSRYEGDWHANSIHGFGHYTAQDGREFVGAWRNDVMHGFGRYSWPDGRVFSGQYVSDRKEGFGIFSWKDGKRFEGWWLQGKQHGQGVLYQRDGQVFKRGHWQHGCAPEHDGNPKDMTREHRAIRNYEKFHSLPVGSTTLGQVEAHPIGVEGWAKFGEDSRRAGFQGLAATNGHIY